MLIVILKIEAVVRPEILAHALCNGDRARRFTGGLTGRRRRGQ
jgi:hypothetical protein